MHPNFTSFYLQKVLNFLLHAGIVLTGLSSCASYSTKYSKQSRNWQATSPDPSGRVAHTVFLIGDAGYDSPDDRAHVLQYLKKKLDSAEKNSSIIFLGDNIYQFGMPPRGDSAMRETAEFRINSQLETLEGFKGRPIFLPGNHDWWGWGAEGVARQADYVQQKIDDYRSVRNGTAPERYFLPRAGCPGPQVAELTDQLVVVVIDSQWWLENRSKLEENGVTCASTSRAAFATEFEKVLDKYQVIVALHHPLYTRGPHGGNFTLKEHIFPLTELNPDLYIPLPGIGSLIALYRGLIGMRQDVANARYRKLRKVLLAGTSQNPGTIFVSGHEHTLQLIQRRAHSFIVSGSGSKQSPVGLGKGSVFASSSMGYSTLVFYEGGQTWVQFWDVGPEGEKATLIFQKKIRE
jgi:hypothetical protein